MNPKAKKVEYLTAKFINERRVDRGRDRLDTDTALVSAAREHSRDMARRGFFDHVNPDGDSPHDRCHRYDNVGECITQVYGFSRSAGRIAGDIVEQFMKSKRHKKNIMDPENHRMGVGVWKKGDKVFVSVELVGANYGRYHRGHHHGTHRTPRRSDYTPAPPGKIEAMLSSLLNKITP